MDTLPFFKPIHPLVILLFDYLYTAPINIHIQDFGWHILWKLCKAQVE